MDVALERFQEACGNGDLKTARRLHAKHKFAAVDVCADCVYAFRQACVRGHLPVARWLHKTFSLTAATVGRATRLLSDVCANGHTNVAEWLWNTYRMTHKDLQYGIEQVFRSCVTGGHLTTILWVHKHTTALRAYITDHVREVVVHICSLAGHIDIIKWVFGMYQTFNNELTEKVINAFRQSFIEACHYGHIKVAKWLYSNDIFRLDRLDLFGKNVINRALESDCLEVVSWLCTIYKFEAITIETAIRDAYDCGHLHIIEYLCQTHAANDDYLANVVGYYDEYLNDRTGKRARILRWHNAMFSISTQYYAFYGLSNRKTKLSYIADRIKDAKRESCATWNPERLPGWQIVRQLTSLQLASTTHPELLLAALSLL